jgi:hypothetical protein
MRYCPGRSTNRWDNASGSQSIRLTIFCSELACILSAKGMTICSLHFTISRNVRKGVQNAGDLVGRELLRLKVCPVDSPENCQYLATHRHMMETYQLVK